MEPTLLVVAAADETDRLSIVFEGSKDPDATEGTGRFGSKQKLFLLLLAIAVGGGETMFRRLLLKFFILLILAWLLELWAQDGFMPVLMSLLVE